MTTIKKLIQMSDILVGLIDDWDWDNIPEDEEEFIDGKINELFNNLVPKMEQVRITLESN